MGSSYGELPLEIHHLNVTLYVSLEATISILTLFFNNFRGRWKFIIPRIFCPAPFPGAPYVEVPGKEWRWGGSNPRPRNLNFSFLHA
jgi:hypothetical protein